MSFSNTIQRYFSNLFISIVTEDSSYRVLCKVIKNSKQKVKFEKIFPAKPNAEFLSEEVGTYINTLQDKYNFTYIAFLLDSMGQGAVKGTQVEDFSKFSVDVKNVKTIKFDTWSAYASFIDINWTNKIYDKIGLDFIYSPFALLYHFLSEHKLNTNSTLYILNQEKSVTLTVFKEKTLNFGVFYTIVKEDGLEDSDEIENWEDEEEVEDVENLANLDTESSEEEMNELEDLSELDTLNEDPKNDTFIDTDSFTKNDDLQQDMDSGVNIEDIELYGRDLHIYKFISLALKEYYNNSIYESDFIEKIVVFDGYDMSKEMIQSLEDDLLLDLEMYKVNVSEAVCDLSIGTIYD
ncbi:MAG: hypothetical protein GXP61_09905 [Epsilonproteobacteria bacterium]|nr:hypothetical protein [Campylobacterota bacterium]